MLCLTHNISTTMGDRAMVSKDHLQVTNYQDSNGHVTDDVTWTRQVKVVTPISLKLNISKEYKTHGCFKLTTYGKPYVTKLMVMWPMMSLDANGNCSRTSTERNAHTSSPIGLFLLLLYPRTICSNLGTFTSSLAMMSVAQRLIYLLDLSTIGDRIADK